jgi:hypothetical protein
MIRTIMSLTGLFPARFLYLFILPIFLLTASVSIMDIAAQPSKTSIAATKTMPSSNRFLTYENNSTLGITIQYPSNWEKDSYHNKLAFFAPSLAEGHNSKIIPVGLFVKVDNLPFEIESVDDYISHYVNKLKEHAEISQPIGVSLTSLAGNLAHNVTYSARLGQYEYRTTDLIMLSGIKKYEITYYIAQGEVKSSNYLPTIQKMIDSFEISIGITGSNPFLTFQNNSTLGITIQYPSNWERTEDGNGNSVLFLSPSESKSDKVLESLSIRVSPNNVPLSKLADRSINYYKQNYNDFHLIESKLITFKHSLAYMLKYAYTDLLFGKGMGIDIGTTTGNKGYIISYFAEPANFSLYLPTIQKMIDSLEIQKNVSNLTSNVDLYTKYWKPVF